MEFKFNLVGERRKALVQAVGDIIGWAPVYKGAPTFAFAVGDYIVDRYGTLIYNERTGLEDVRGLLAKLSESGFVPENPVEFSNHETGVLASEDEAAESVATTDKLAIEISLAGFTDTALDNLRRLVSSKAALIMKAIGVDDLPIERLESTIRFPWFPASTSADKHFACSLFICALCDMAKNQKRVTMREASFVSEKYAFRCFLLRLGFIGPQFAAARKILLANLAGDGAFKSGKRKEREGAPVDANSVDTVAENLFDANVTGDEKLPCNAAFCAKEPLSA